MTKVKKSESQRTGLPHPTPVQILNAIADQAELVDLHRKSLNLPPVAHEIMLVARRGVWQANREFHDED